MRHFNDIDGKLKRNYRQWHTTKSKTYGWGCPCHRNPLKSVTVMHNSVYNNLFDIIMHLKYVVIYYYYYTYTYNLYVYVSRGVVI